ILETYDAIGTIVAAADLFKTSPRKLHYRLKEYREQGWIPRTTRSRSLTPDESLESRGEALKASEEKRLKVLLAEEDDELRGALSEFLIAEGYDVVSVPDGRMFLEQLGGAMLFGEGE